VQCKKRARPGTAGVQGVPLVGLSEELGDNLRWIRHIVIVVKIGCYPLQVGDQNGVAHKFILPLASYQALEPSTVTGCYIASIAALQDDRQRHVPRQFWLSFQH
jgi:hypothetical protein